MKKSRIEFNNFKPFAEHIQQFDLKAITFVYGKNSIGKSSIIHLIGYINYILDKKSFDAYEIKYGDTINLGGFRNFVNQKDLQKKLSIKIPITKDGVSCAIKMNIGIHNEDTTLLGIDYFMYDECFFSVDVYKEAYVNINSRYMREWLELTMQNGGWTEDEIFEAIDIQNDGYMKFGETINPYNVFVKEYKSDIYELYALTHDSVIETAFQMTYWNKKCEKMRLRVSDLKRGRPARDAKSEKPAKKDTEVKTGLLEKLIKNDKNYKFHNYVSEMIRKKQNLLSEATEMEKFDIDPYQIDVFGITEMRDVIQEIDDMVISLKSIFLHMALTAVIDMNQLYRHRFDIGLNYIGPLRYYPKREDMLSNLGYVEPNDSESFWHTLREDASYREEINQKFKALEIPYRIKLRKLYEVDEKALKKDEITFVTSELYFEDINNHAKVHNREMGLGITQLLPIIGNCTVRESSVIAIEQPELHLHPSLQSKVADILIESCAKRNNFFLVETHSEHLLLRIMKRMRQTAEGTLEDENLRLTPDDVAVLYVDNDGEKTYILELELDEDGTLLDPWPGGFFEEGFAERFF